MRGFKVSFQSCVKSRHQIFAIVVLCTKMNMDWTCVHYYVTRRVFVCWRYRIENVVTNESYGCWGGLRVCIALPPPHLTPSLPNLYANGGGRGLEAPPRVKPGHDGSRGMEGNEAETGELLPVSVGRGPGECSMCRGFVGASFPPSAPCQLIGETWKEGEGHHMEADREFAGRPTYNVPFFLLQTNIRRPPSLCNRTKAP